MGEPEELALELTAVARTAGADVVGFGDVTEGLHPEFWPLARAVSLGCALPVRVGEGLAFPDEPTVARLVEAGRAVAACLRRRKQRFFVLPSTGEGKKGYCAALFGHFSHKVAATCAGLGWVGKHGLLVSPEFGSAVLWGTVLTDACLPVGRPVRRGRCGSCTICRDACLPGAVQGREWRRGLEFGDLVNKDGCAAQVARLQREGKTCCGRCMAACPYNFIAVHAKEHSEGA